MPFSHTKTAHPPTPLQIWIDRLRFVLGVVAVIAIAVTFALNRSEQSDINNRITKVESPCLRYGSDSKQCHESFQAAVNSITDYQLCILLVQRPDLTGVSPADCKRIAKEARQEAEHSAQRSPSGSSPAPSGSTQPEPSSSPPGDVGSQSPDTGHPHGSPSPGQHEPSPPPPDSPSVPAPDSSASPSQQSPPAASEGPAPVPAQESPSAVPPPVVGIEVPKLPVHVCVPGVASINC